MKCLKANVVKVKQKISLCEEDIKRPYQGNVFNDSKSLQYNLFSVMLFLLWKMMMFLRNG